MTQALAVPSKHRTFEPTSSRITSAMENPELELAWNFIEKTNRSIFLTGKAGTGKTTFLHKIKAESKKRLVVVAPTGVAAINAKGVTIHSFFQMPFGPILPEGAQNAHQKAEFAQKFNKKKLDILRSMDLLIIDEISMVRADLLDGIDQVLRRFKNRERAFGGVQVLMIGDLQQLAPVVKPHEWDLLRAHYPNPYFFSSQAFKKVQAVGIELKHIYRQDDQVFIDILNEIRNNKLSDASAKKLNERYIPNFSPPKNAGYITLTTHNNRAQSMNQLELQKLKTHSRFFKATIEGKFPAHAYPTHEKLELKVGAQVMFVKNDSQPEKRYFNGKIGTITQMDGEEIVVRCPEDDFDIHVNEEVWDNIKYTINAKSKAIEEDKVGSFTQIPLRLAWAITIHKSQGLTFEKAVIDAQASFAHGQTYVALSRCKSLEGIVLLNPLSHKSIINDDRVTSFTQHVEAHLPGQIELNASQQAYQLMLMEDLFNFQSLLYPIRRLISIYNTFESSLKGVIIEPLMSIQDEGIFPLQKVSQSFKAQLHNLSIASKKLPQDDVTIQERLQKGINYFLNFSEDKLQKPFSKITYLTDNQAVKKDLQKQLTIFEEQLAQKVFVLKGLSKGFSTQLYLELRAKAILVKAKAKSKKTSRNPEYTSTDHPELFSQLRSWRDQMAQEEAVPHFHIITQATLFELCHFLPTTLKELAAVYGFGKKKMEQFGEELLSIIGQYTEAHQAKPVENILTSKEKKKKKNPKGTSHQISFDLFKQGFSIQEIAKKRDYAVSTIEVHLAKFVASGDIPVTDLIPKDRFHTLRDLMTETNYDSLSDLKRKIGGDYSYFELRLVQKWIG